MDRVLRSVLHSKFTNFTGLSKHGVRNPITFYFSILSHPHFLSFYFIGLFFFSASVNLGLIPPRPGRECNGEVLLVLKRSLEQSESTK